MSQRAVNRKGWGQQTAGSITPGALTSAYPYKQVYFPASCMTLDAVDPAIFQAIQIGALEKTFDVITYLNAVNTEAEWNFCLKDTALDESDPQFKLFPLWFQALDAVNPNDNVYFEGYIQNCVIGNTLNTSFGVGDFMPSPTQVQWSLAGGSDVGAQESMNVGAPSGDALVASGANFLQFQFERHGAHVNDTYDKEVHLLGVTFQYKTKFANVAQWPVYTPP